MQTTRKALAGIKSTASTIFALVVSAMTWFLCFALAGISMLVSGVYILAGHGWALVSGGVLCMALAGFIRKGMTHG